ncbi:MAG TPA: hypothetical protein VGL60_03020 [Acidimicrobiales bacterium]|jgi:hypothetical protein
MVGILRTVSYGGLVGAPPASQNANLEALVEGAAISLAARHAKVRREGYLD